MLDVVEVNDLTELRSYHLAWTALHAETPRATFFQTFDWLESWWRHEHEGKRLRVIIVRAEGRPIGVVPLVEQTEPGRLGPVRVLTYPLENWGSWYGPIGANQTATLTVAMRHVARTPRTWDVFAARHTAHATFDRGRTELAMRLAGLGPSVEAAGTTSVIDLASHGDWEGYLASRGAKVRHELRRQRRKLEREHELGFVRHRPDSMSHGDGAPRWDLYDACRAVADRSWQATSETGNTLSSPGVAGLLERSHESASRLGMSDMSVLTAGGRPVAYYYAYCCRGEVTGLRTGYDPDYPGAGSVLLGRVIEDSFARGDKRLDFGPGDEAYKRRLRTAAEPISRLTHVAPGAWRPRVLRAARRLAERIGRAG